MPKRIPKIKWRATDETNLTKLVRNFNAKIRRLEKKSPELIKYLPPKLTKAEFKKDITTRKDFNRRFNEYSRFLRKGAEKIVKGKSGLTITEWEKKENTIKAQIVTQARKKNLEFIESLDITDKGKPTGIKRGQRRYTQAEKENKPKKFNFNKIRSGKEYEMFKKALEKEAMADYFTKRYEQYKINYLTALDNEFGGRANSLIEILEKVDPETLFEGLYSDPDLHLKYIYSAEQKDVILEYLMETWPNYLEFIELGGEV